VRRLLLPWVPFAVAMLALVAASYKAMAADPESPGAKLAMIWWMPYVLVGAYGFVYVVPMLLLEWARSVRRRSAAPPSVGRTAVALALPALFVGVVQPLGIAFAIFFRWTPLARVALGDLPLVAGIWGLSVLATGLWVLGAAIHWIWLARPASVEGTRPYR
jgi:hypothetical protein